jgi:hypothetical protein
MIKFVKITLLLLYTIAATQCTSKGEWKDLFNGNDFTGWERKGGPAEYIIENNEIIGITVDDRNNSFLCTIEEYGDFILELELLVDTTMNSGIQFRSHSLPNYKNGLVHGYQMEIDPSKRAWSGGIYDEGRRGWIYSLDHNPEAKTAFKNGIWNHYRIEAFGKHIKTFVNGIPTADILDSVDTPGFIALQVHGIAPDYNEKTVGAIIKWRNIRILTKDVEKNLLVSEREIVQLDYSGDTKIMRQ